MQDLEGASAVVPSSNLSAFRYATRGARNAYVAAMLAGATGALIGVATQQWELLVPAIAVVAIAERLRPYAGEHAQIRLDPDGMTLRGLGFLPWRMVSEARVFEHRTGGGVRVWLMLELARDIERAARRQSQPPLVKLWRRLQIRPWRLVGGRGLILRLEGLDQNPDAIRHAFEQFSNRRIAVDRV